MTSTWSTSPPEESLRRAIVRDLELFGSREEVERRNLGRYLPFQALSREESHPRAVADLVVDGS
ncbi:MAG TPA: hypothetical protein VI076_08065 [Actinopolymorphaceae bacterium]